MLKEDEGGDGHQLQREWRQNLQSVQSTVISQQRRCIVSGGNRLRFDPRVIVTTVRTTTDPCGIDTMIIACIIVDIDCTESGVLFAERPCLRGIQKANQ